MASLLEELERMSANAVDSFPEDINESEIKRWQILFAVGFDEAKEKIQSYRADINRQRFSDELWHDMKASKEAQGYDRESCEYDLFCRSRVKSTVFPTRVSLSSNVLRGLILGGPLDTPEHVRDIAGWAKAPTVTTAESQDTDGSTNFCYVTADEEYHIRQGLHNRGITYEPCFITINIAAKDLHTSAFPTLGIVDTTLPQHRPSNIADLVQQDQYPVLYFFYGTLAQPEVLERVLEFEDQVPVLHEAHVFGAEVRALGRYRGLVDSRAEARVDGYGFVVRSEEQERILRVYETKMYEVVRCDVWLAEEKKPINRLTFRAARDV